MRIIPGTRYRIVTRVGAGAMGAVYQAEHIDLEKRVALKTLLANSARDSAVVERFRQEARAASKIGNPYICDVTDFGELPDGQVFYVMEFIDGPSLRRVLEVDQHLGPERVIPILRQVCKALGAAHDKGIIHLDVKPDNIMLTTSGRRGGMVKVVDFGIAGLISAEPPPEGASGEDRIVGTPDYLSPERIRRKGYDNRSDIYSLGAMAYEMLTGSCPFWHEDLLTTITKHITDKPQPLRQRAPELDIPEKLETVVLQMLEKNPAERPQSMAVVEAMLCEAQIAARIQTEWDDLELPAVDEDWQKKLAERMPSPRSRRMRRMRWVWAWWRWSASAWRCTLACAAPRKLSPTHRSTSRSPRPTSQKASPPGCARLASPRAPRNSSSPRPIRRCSTSSRPRPRPSGWARPRAAPRCCAGSTATSSAAWAIPC